MWRRFVSFESLDGFLRSLLLDLRDSRLLLRWRCPEDDWLLVGRGLVAEAVEETESLHILDHGAIDLVCGNLLQVDV